VETYLQMPLNDGAIFRPGRNKLTIRLQSPDERPRIQVVEAQVAVFEGK